MLTAFLNVVIWMGKTTNCWYGGQGEFVYNLCSTLTWRTYLGLCLLHIFMDFKLKRCTSIFRGPQGGQTIRFFEVVIRLSVKRQESYYRGIEYVWKPEPCETHTPSEHSHLSVPLLNQHAYFMFYYYYYYMWYHLRRRNLILLTALFFARFYTWLLQEGPTIYFLETLHISDKGWKADIFCRLKCHDAFGKCVCNW